VIAMPQPPSPPEDPPPATLAGRLAGDRSGVSAMFVGLSLAAVLGCVGLGIDLGSWYNLRRQAQNAADSAAFSAAAARTAGASNLADQAYAITAPYGFTNGSGGTTVTVNTPPGSGSYAGQAGAVEVIVSKPAPSFFSRLFIPGGQILRARAVARTATAGDACVLALHATATASALETGSANVQLNGCALVDNSTSSTAFQLKGAAQVSASSIRLAGGYSLSNNSSLTAPGGIKTNQAPVPDPYADVPIPSYSGCTYNGASLSSGSYTSSSASPTVFCNGLTLNNGVNVTLAPGVYIIDRGALQIDGGATLSGAGVTLVLTSSTGSNYATAQINGNSVVNLSAPTSGATAGLAFYQDRNAPSSGGDTFNGGSTQNIQGAIYFPNQTLTFSGGSSTATAGCTEIIAGSVSFQGNSTLAINCAGSGVRLAGGSPVKLVE